MNDSLGDEKLMGRVRDGAVELLGVLFDRYHLALFNFFYRLSNNRASSEDLVQETFYRILKYRRSYKDGSAFRTWMYQIARHARIDSLSRKRGEVELNAAPMGVVFPIDSLHEQQQISLLRKALLRLPEETRELLVLSRFQELKYEEIAALLQCQPGTVKVRVHRAMQALRETYRAVENECRSKSAGFQAGR
jgi:RNA polymerase sigma factor (sigma-70 family)